ncbi:MAG TPA: hypothetical protein VGD56_18505, partial [Gemmatirosa sp.]
SAPPGAATRAPSAPAGAPPRNPATRSPERASPAAALAATSTRSATATATAAPTIPATGGAARRTLDSITAALDPSTADAAAGRAAAGALRALLPRLTSGNDSAWALVRTVEANALAGDQDRACAALRAARASARSDAQREAIRRYDGVLGCS